MRTWQVVAAGLLVAAGPWSVVHAADPSSAPAGDTANRSAGVTRGAETTGTVTGVDRSKGMVNVKLENGAEVAFAMPATALHGFSRGDRVVVSSRVSVTGTPDAPSPTGGRRR
jgi:hypothetical protein